VHIIGAGPVGLTLALRLAPTRDVVLYARARNLGTESAADRGEQRNSAGQRNCVEAVPAGLVALLIEIGIHPNEIGVDMLHRQKNVAWEHRDAQCVAGSHIANVERPKIEAALMRCAVRTRQIDIRAAIPETLRSLIDSRPPELHDATGRRAFTAVSREVVSGGPVARTWTRRVTLPIEQRRFRMAALPDGYVYSLASATRVMIGWCGNKRLVSLRPDAWYDYLHNSDVGMFDDLALRGTAGGGWVQGKTGAAGVQRAFAKTGCSLVGDAAFSRDALCSQGLAIGLSDAVYAATVKTTAQRILWQEHRNIQYVSHLKFLTETIARCRFNQSEFWREYAMSLVIEKSKFEAAVGVNIDVEKVGW
jgi:hypothetical protein